jgi:hypothetical protein
MNDLINDPKAVAATMVILMSIAGFFGRRELRRLDKAIENSVRRREFEQLREDMDERHQENLQRLDKIDTAVTGTHQRVDTFLMKLPELLTRK